MEFDTRFEIDEWQAVPIKETIALMRGKLASGADKNSRTERPRGSKWVVTAGIKPVDLYVYLKARFGEPNGVTMLGKNRADSANLIHWHYTLQCPSGTIEILCTQFRIEVFQPFTNDVSALSLFLSAIKTDFAHYGQQMGEVRKGLEKWQIFLNPYVRLKDMLEEQLAELDELGLDQVKEPQMPRLTTHFSGEAMEEFKHAFSEVAKKYSKAAQICLSVRMLAPVWAESFVNLILFVLARPEIRDDSRLYETTLRQNIDIRIKSLHLNCVGFEMGVPYDEWDACKKFHTMMNGRNDMLHGNVDPRLTTFQELYFEDKTPLFIEFEDFAFFSYKTSLLNATPEQALQDYQTVQDLAAHILICLSNSAQAEVRRIILTRDLGWDAARKKIGILFPDYSVDWGVVFESSESNE